jgi:hypothetical protein
MELALWIAVGLLAAYLVLYVALKFIFPSDT